jgi:hypothetical protein
VEVEKRDDGGMHASEGKTQRIEELAYVQDTQLLKELDNHDKEIWDVVGGKMGMSASECKKRATELGWTRV